MRLPKLTRHAAGALAGVAVLALVACQGPDAVAPSRGPLFWTTTEPPELGDFKLCKVGTAASFTVSINGGAPTTVTLADGACQIVAVSNNAIATVTVTELSDPAIVLDSITVVQFLVTSSTPVVEPTITGTSTVTRNVSGDVGVIATFYNHPAPPRGEGCTPGYWRNHLSQWATTGFATGDDFDATFGVNLFNPNITLLQAIKLGGGGVNRLARHGTAALLSAASVINYPYTVAQVIALVQAGDADALAAANELPCPLD